METFILVAAYFAVMFITVPVMRFAFRNEIKPIVEETICYDQDVVVVETVTVEMKPVFHYNTETNQMVCRIAGMETVYNMSSKQQSKKAMEIIAHWNGEQQKAAEAIEEAQELLLKVKDSIVAKNERYRGHEWGVKSKLRK